MEPYWPVFEMRRLCPLKTHGQLVADHDNTFDIGVAVSIIEEGAGIHVAEVHFVGKIAEQLVNNPKICFPARFVIVFERIGNQKIAGYTKGPLQG